MVRANNINCPYIRWKQWPAGWWRKSVSCRRRVSAATSPCPSLHHRLRRQSARVTSEGAWPRPPRAEDWQVDSSAGRDDALVASPHPNSKAILDNTLRPHFAPSARPTISMSPVFIVKQNLVEINARSFGCYAVSYPHGKYFAHHIGPITWKMTSSTKQEVHNATPHITIATVHDTQQIRSFNLLVWRCSFRRTQAERQTDRHTHPSQYFAPLLRRNNHTIISYVPACTATHTPLTHLTTSTIL